jgi:hypothetical protein
MSDDWTTVNTSTVKEEEEKVEFEIENQSQPKQPELDFEDTDNVQQKAKEQGQDEETEEKESGAQKRIRQLVRQRKEREQQIAELQKRQEELEHRLKAKEEEYNKSLKETLDSNERQIGDRLELAKKAYRQAVESGDADQMLAAQEAMSNAQFESAQIKQSQDAYNKYQHELELEAQQRQQAQTQAQEAYDPKAISWAGRNPWFGQDQILTQAALQIDAGMKDEGYDPSDDEYYEEIDKRLQATFPNRFEPSQTQTRTEAPTNASQVVAGASRTPNPSSGRKVKLSQEDVRLAEKWGIPLEQYAAEKLKVEKADGEYTNINQRGGY